MDNVAPAALRNALRVSLTTPEPRPPEVIHSRTANKNSGTGGDMSGEASRGIPASVFVVDDNDVVRRTLCGIIRQDPTLRFVGEAAHGGPALDAIRAKAPDLVCLDVMMEGLDGISVAAQLRAEEMTTKIVLVTGYASAEVIARARELGVAGVVVKPFGAARVLGTIHAALAEAPAAEVTSA
jgi:two-component system chemotaxis response regulator CheY